MKKLILKILRSCPEIIQRMIRLILAIPGAIVDPKGFGFLKLMLENANVPLKYRYMLGNVPPGDILIDCGANVGLITDIGLFQEMEVYAFEPNKAALRLLNKKYANNPKVHLYPVAVSDKNTTLTFYSTEQELFDQGATIISSGAKLCKHNQSYEVECVRLVNSIKNDILPKHKHIHLLKLDVEGAEFAIMEDIITS